MLSVPKRIKLELVVAHVGLVAVEFIIGLN